MMNLIETEWLYHHGAPKSFSADPEFCRPIFEKFLISHKVTLKPRPSRSSAKNGHVERNNGVFKTILSRLSKEVTASSPAMLVARASFMSSMFHGNAILSAFQLARGYSPSILGVPSSDVSQSMLDAHMESVAVRAINRVSRSKMRNVEPRSSFPKGAKVWIYYKTSKQNERPRWVEAWVIEAEVHMVKCRRNKKGPPMSVAYEHIRIAPKGELAQELMKCSLEEELAQDENTTTAITDMCKTITENEDEDEENAQAMKRDLSRNVFGDGEDNDMTASEGRVGSLFTKNNQGDPMQDVGELPQGTGTEQLEDIELKSQEQETLEEIHKILGSAQVTRRKMECAPPWIVNKAIEAELKSNCKDAYEEVMDADVPQSANVIGSHIVYNIKVEENGKKRLKARLCPHGNRDKEKDDIRKDSATAQFDVIRLVCSLATILGFRLGCLDVRGAYLQSGPIQRDIYVRPPPEWKGKRGVIWHLLKMSYGISEAGRQWAKVIENWMIQRASFGRVRGVPQMFIRRTKEGNISIIEAKVTDDPLIAGSVEDIKVFSKHISKRFPISKVIIDGAIKFNGADITQDKYGSVSISMDSYMQDIRSVTLDQCRRKEAY